jgi:hypothetical protein
LVRSAVLITIATAAMFCAGIDANASANPTNQIAICHTTESAGVDTDTCVGNPAVDDASPDSGPNVIVRPRLWIGIGAGI